MSGPQQEWWENPWTWPFLALFGYVLYDVFSEGKIKLPPPASAPVVPRPGQVPGMIQVPSPIVPLVLQPGQVPSGTIQPFYPLTPPTVPSPAEPDRISASPVSNLEIFWTPPATTDLFGPLSRDPPECEHLRPVTNAPVTKSDLLAINAMRMAYLNCLLATTGQKQRQCRAMGGMTVIDPVNRSMQYCVKPGADPGTAPGYAELKARCRVIWGQPAQEPTGGVSDRMIHGYDLQVKYSGHSPGHRHGTSCRIYCTPPNRVVRGA